MQRSKSRLPTCLKCIKYHLSKTMTELCKKKIKHKIRLQIRRHIDPPLTCRLSAQRNYMQHTALPTPNTFYEETINDLLDQGIEFSIE